ncbi:DUF6388 family protein [Pseudomonas sp. nanlin1]|uniref:DUF6388 family protein n=1 Tax=Pseudomonas sp. nanlin1 TaxID=3040605 RepID=UPI00388E29C0
MIAKEDRHEAAIAKFLALKPDLKEEIQDLEPGEQQQQIEWAFEDEAQSQGFEPWEWTLELIAQSPAELEAMRREVHQEAAETLGMAWNEYCQLNDIKP